MHRSASEQTHLEIPSAYPWASNGESVQIILNSEKGVGEHDHAGASTQESDLLNWYEFL